MVENNGGTAHSLLRKMTEKTINCIINHFIATSFLGERSEPHTSESGRISIYNYTSGGGGGGGGGKGVAELAHSALHFPSQGWTQDYLLVVVVVVVRGGG